MRKDIYERMKKMKQEDIKPNYAELAKMYDCDYRTVKRYFENDIKVKAKIGKTSKLDPYREIIKEKLLLCCTFTSIYHFIKKRGYEGKYTILREYCKTIKIEETIKATIRFETSPGLQAQVDWKEQMQMTSRKGEIFYINIFLIVLGYSRMKYIELTLDRNQDTLMNSMINSFKYFKGIPKEILFDNMKTVIDQSKTNYQSAVVNNGFYEFSKDMNFEVIACRAYRPQTKGKVESLAKAMERLRPYNHEFDNLQQLDEIIKSLNYDINDNISMATGERPFDRWEKEKEYLHSLTDLTILDDYLTRPITRIVTKESMITYLNCKYSVDPRYISKTVDIEVKDNYLFIYYNKLLLARHQLNNKKFNYDKEHMVQILKSDVFKHKSDDEINKHAEKQLKLYDKL